MRLWKRSLAALGMAGLFTGAAPGADVPLKEGDKAPIDIAVPALQIEKALPDKKDAKTLKLADFKGKPVVLFFFPAAMTRG